VKTEGDGEDVSRRGGVGPNNYTGLMWNLCGVGGRRRKGEKGKEEWREGVI